MTTKRTKIPESIDPAKDRLTALDGIATATEWERAAIVWAFTYDGKTKAGRVRKEEAANRSTAIYTVTEFIGLKIKGLTSDHTVKHYRDNWQVLIDAGEAADILPGDALVLPDRDWPIEKGNQGSRATPSNIGKQMAADPDLLAAALEAATDLAPEAVASQVAKPKVAKKVVHNKAATKQVIQQQSAKTRKIVKQRKAAASDPTAAAQTAAAVDATAAAEGGRTNSPEYTRMIRALAEARRAWFAGVKEQTFTPFDRHLLGGDLPSINRLVEELTTFVETEDDPYAAVTQVRAEREEQFNREYDEAESGTDIESGLEEIERYANEASA